MCSVVMLSWPGAFFFFMDCTEKSSSDWVIVGQSLFVAARALRAPSATRQGSGFLEGGSFGKNLSASVLKMVDSELVWYPSEVRNSDICVVPRSFPDIFFRAVNGSRLSSSVQKVFHDCALAFLISRWKSALMLFAGCIAYSSWFATRRLLAARSFYRKL